MKNKSAIIWGVELSPFVLKLQACLDHARVRHKRLPHHGGYAENTQTLLRLEYLKQRKLVTRYPEMDPELDEYPAAPFFSQNGTGYQYDSSSIALFLDESKTNTSTPLYPTKPILNFVARLIDEAFDEFGLYMVHHMRWVGSAKSNVMGKLLAKEFKHALPPGGPLLLARHFPKRQVRRCPYLFSVAPRGYRCGMPKDLTPPNKKGFPETHTLLNESWKQYLKGMEEILTRQAYLLGDSFTVADASAYGQLAMNLVDPEAAKKLEALAPTTFAWLNKIYRHQHTNSRGDHLQLSEVIKPLLNTIMSTFSSLMIQNYQAYQSAKLNNVRVFNEQAFNEGAALYDGKLRGYPFRAVIKTFQVRVWQEICHAWQKLSPEDKQEL